MPSRPLVSGRVRAVACGCALVGAALVVGVNDPSAPGSRFPGCMFHQATGLWCPGCGLTRATHDLLHGDVVSALGSNLFTPFVLLAVVATWWAWTRRSFGLLIGAMVLFAMLRNVPAAPFDALAP